MSWTPTCWRRWTPPGGPGGPGLSSTPSRCPPGIRSGITPWVTVLPHCAAQTDPVTAAQVVARNLRTFQAQGLLDLRSARQRATTGGLIRAAPSPPTTRAGSQASAWRAVRQRRQSDLNCASAGDTGLLCQRHSQQWPVSMTVDAPRTAGPGRPRAGTAFGQQRDPSPLGCRFSQPQRGVQHRARHFGHGPAHGLVQRGHSSTR